MQAVSVHHYTLIKSPVRSLRQRSSSWIAKVVKDELKNPWCGDYRWRVAPQNGTGCTSGAVHVHKARPAGCGHTSLSLPAITVASQVFLAAIVVYSLLFYASNRSHVCNRNLVKLRKNVFNLLKPFPIKKRSQFRNETRAVCKPELWDSFSKARVEALLRAAELLCSLLSAVGCRAVTILSCRQSSY